MFPMTWVLAGIGICVVSLLEHGDKLYGDSEEEKELFDQYVDMTIVSRICQLST